MPPESKQPVGPVRYGSDLSVFQSQRFNGISADRAFWRNVDVIKHWSKALLEEKVDSIAEMWRRWVTGIQYEINYWDHQYSVRGGAYAEDFNRRHLAHGRIDEMADKVIGRIAKKHISILDVGAGPVTCLGNTHPEATLAITATDPLSQQYDDICEKYGVRGPIPTIFALAEDLESVFDAESFDIVHCQNALDHSIDPVRALLQMLTVCRVGGYVMLRHAHNEAENENYQGFHQWNLSLDGSHFIIWNRDERIDFSHEVAGFADHEVLMSEGYLINIFRKRHDVPRGLSGDSRQRNGAFQKAAIRSLGIIPVKSSIEK